ncbi:MAG: diacylglycerol kinase [Flavobacteriales bacterium]|nr:diacylglycerol kinase [Flavobacteriales bacterium]|tara:strand:+ start:27329 stop:28195 length:867 start_codon:yes stop_codon:yes gene_type:complete
MKIRFIINPFAGNGKQRNIDSLIKKYIKHPYDILYTKKSGEATILSKQAVQEGIGIVIAVGGDGTVNECAKALIDNNTALGVIPCGSGNGFAYHLGMHKNISRSIQQLNTCQIRTIDSGTVNNIPFVNVSGIGFDAHIASLFAKKDKRGFINYLKLILKELKYKSKTYTIKYEGGSRTVKAYLIAFANASQYGNNAMISPLANTEDGLIDFVIMKEFPKWKIPLILFNIIKGRIHLSNHIDIIQARELTIHSKEELIHLDGEPHCYNSPLNIKIKEQSLNIFMPDEKK